MVEKLALLVTQNPWLVITGFVITVLGLPLSIFLYFRSIRVKKPVCLVRSSSLVRHQRTQFPDLEIRYGGNIVHSLTVSTIVIWNAGRETINRNDIPETDPLRIEPPPGEWMCEAKILTENNAACDFSLDYSVEKQACIVRFEY